MYGESWSQECVLYILIHGEHSKKKEEKEEEKKEMVEPLCLFCLEDLKENQECPNVVGCGCEINCHSSCLETWFQQKNQMECPICHTVVQQNPSSRVELSHTYMVVHIRDPRNTEQIRNIQSREKCVGFCCLTLLFWWIAALILEYAF